MLKLGAFNFGVILWIEEQMTSLRLLLYNRLIVEMFDFLVKPFLFRSKARSHCKKWKRASRTCPFPKKLRPLPSTKDTKRSKRLKRKWKRLSGILKRNILSLTNQFTTRLWKETHQRGIIERFAQIFDWGRNQRSSTEPINQENWRLLGKMLRRCPYDQRVDGKRRRTTFESNLKHSRCWWRRLRQLHYHLLYWRKQSHQ